MKIASRVHFAGPIIEEECPLQAFPGRADSASELQAALVLNVSVSICTLSSWMLCICKRGVNKVVDLCFTTSWLRVSFLGMFYFQPAAAAVYIHEERKTYEIDNYIFRFLEI